jgi:hypothetical protein
VKGRATTDDQKALIMRELLTAWMRVPEMRLGQLLEVALDGYDATGRFYIEDETLAQEVNAAAREKWKR